MALVIADRVRETTTTTGTGAVTLAGAYASFQTFLAAIGNGNSTYYTIASASSGEWEVGIGTYTSGTNTLSRDTVLASSNSGSLVTFSAGSKDVFVTQPAERSLLVQSAGSGLFSSNAAFTANGVPYASSTSALTTGSSLTFDGTNLGIGTSSPVNTAAGRGNVTINGSSSSILSLTVGGANKSYIYCDGTNLDINNQANGYMTFQTNATERMRIDSSGNVGIGTSSPGTRLHVADTNYPYITVSNTTGTQIKNIFGANGITQVAYLGTETNHPLGFLINDAEKMRLDASGNLGLGVTPSASWFTGSKVMQFGATGALWNNGSNNTSISHNAVFGDATTTYIQSRAASYYRQIDGAHNWFTAPSGTAGNAISFTQAMTLDVSGNLGIGTTSPTDRLHVVGTASRFDKSNGVAVGQIRLLTTTDSYATAWALGQPASSTSFAVQYFNGSSWSTQATFDSSGNLGLGVTPSAAGTYKLLQLPTAGQFGTAGDTGFVTANAYLAGAGTWTYAATNVATRYAQEGGAHHWSTAASGTAGNAISFTQAMTLDASGNLGIGTTSPGQKLHVYNNGAVAALQVQNNAYSSFMYLDNTNGTQIGTNSLTLPIYFYVGAAERMRLDSSGNLGLGVTPSAWTSDYNIMQLGSAGSIGGHTSTSLPWALVNANYFINSAGNPLFIQAGYAPRYILRGDNGTHSWWTTNSGSAGGSVSFTQAMTLDASGNLGVGTTSPQNNTSFGYGGISIGGSTGGILSLVSGATEIGRLQAYSGTTVLDALSGSLAFRAGSAERMRLDASGNLGLGVTPSSWNTGYKGFQIGAQASIVGYSGNYLWAGCNWVETATGPKYIGTGQATLYGQNAGMHFWSTAASGTAGNAISFTQAMTLDASGNLGIGTSSPGYKLDVNGRISYSGAIGEGADATLSSSGTVLLHGNSSTWTEQRFYTGGTERARIDSSGNLLVGTTSNPGLARVRVSNGGNDVVSAIQTAAGGYCYKSDAFANSGVYYHMEFQEAGTARGSITSNGTATSYNTSSDYRLKNITGPVTNSGAYIDSLKPVEGTWKVDGSTFVGLIAHEAQEVSRTPVATGEKDGEQIQGMDYSNSEFIANIIAELQSLRKRVAELESK